MNQVINAPQGNRQANYAVHVKRLKAKHFLYAIPRYNFRFGHDNAKQHANR